MIDFSACDKSDLTEVLEVMAYRLLHYQHPSWYSVPEEEIYYLLREEGLFVQLVDDYRE
jgi:hypothetical protein